MSKGAEDQFKEKNLACDDFEDVTIKKGTKLYRLDMAGDEHGNWYATEEDAKDYITRGKDGKDHFDVERFCDDYQIPLYYKESSEENSEENSKEATYKDHVSVYKAKEDFHAEKGIVDANYAYGHGGKGQVYVPEEEQSHLEPVKGEEYEYEVDNREHYDIEEAKEMQRHGTEVASVTKGEVSERTLKTVNTLDDRKLDKENEMYFSTKDLEELRESERYSADKIQSLQEYNESDKYDDTDSW